MSNEEEVKRNALSEAMRLRYIFGEIASYRRLGFMIPINHMLTKVDPDKDECGFVASYLRSTAGVRKMLPEWDNLYRRAWLSFQRQGLSPDYLLRNMVVTPLRIPNINLRSPWN